MSDEENDQPHVFAMPIQFSRPDPEKVRMGREEVTNKYMNFLNSLEKDQVIVFRDIIQFTVRDEVAAGIFIGMATQRFNEFGLDWFGDPKMTAEEFLAKETEAAVIGETAKPQPQTREPEFADNWQGNTLVAADQEQRRLDRELTEAELIYIDQHNDRVFSRLKEKQQFMEDAAPKRADGYPYEDTDAEYLMNLSKYNMVVVGEAGGRVRCSRCQLEYVTLADRMLREPDECHGCMQKDRTG